MPSSKINENVIKDHTNPRWILDRSSIWEDWLMQHAANGRAAGAKVEHLLDAQVHVDCPLQVGEELLPHSGGVKVLDLRMSGFQTGHPGAERGHAGEVIPVFWRRALGPWRSWWKWLEAGWLRPPCWGRRLMTWIFSTRKTNESKQHWSKQLPHLHTWLEPLWGFRSCFTSLHFDWLLQWGEISFSQASGTEASFSSC